MDYAKRLNTVDLCSGIGGFALGFRWAGMSDPILFCDTDEWCRRVLKKNFPNTPLANDVREVADEPSRFIRQRVDIVTAGYPCQPFSHAARLRRGEEDPRHIFPHILRIVTQTRPTWCVFENVHGHLSLGLDTVLDAMATEGYASRTFIVPATGVGARHQRKRLWIVGYSPHNGCDGRGEDARQGWSQGEQKQPEPDLWSQSSGSGFDVADPQSFGVEGLWGGGEQVAFSHDGQRVSLCGSQRPSPTQWAAEPRLDRVADGIPNRVDRIKGLGNAIVPQIAMNIGLAIVEHERKFGVLHNC